MKIIHNVSLTIDQTSKDEFSNLDIQLDLGFDGFKIDENDERWVEVEKLISKFEAIDIISTQFTTKEKKGAAFLRVVGSWHHGYPEPSDDFGYLNQTYHGKQCVCCGAGLVQKAPFRFAKEPKWGAKSLMQVNWVFDELFVKLEVWEKIFKPLNIKKREVLGLKNNTPLSTVVQLVIPDTDISHHFDAKAPKSSCSACSTIKYEPVARGFFPELRSESNLHLFRTKDYFGSGSSAHKAIIISNELYDSLKKHKIKGGDYQPLGSSL